MDGDGGGAVQHLPLPPCNVRSFNHSMQCGARWTRLENPASVRANWTDLAGGDVGGAGHETEGHGPGSARPRVVLPPSAGLGRSRPRKAGEEPPRVSGVQPHQQPGGVRQQKVVAASGGGGGGPRRRRGPAELRGGGPAGRRGGHTVSREQGGPAGGPRSPPPPWRRGGEGKRFGTSPEVRMGGQTSLLGDGGGGKDGSKSLPKTSTPPSGPGRSATAASPAAWPHGPLPACSQPPSPPAPSA